MVIAHNLLVLNGKRMNGITEKKIAKTTKKLSSGYKINMASDDAAGLAISEEMRKQIRGLRRGTDNIEDGISLVQTAEGALGEVTEILQRVNELSIQAYNGTNSRDDKKICQEEIDELFKEITRIADSTTFNECKVLKGNPTTVELHTYVVQEAREVTEIKTYPFSDLKKDLPDWMNVDDRLEEHPAYENYEQDVSGVMIVDDYDAGVRRYYGPKDANVKEEPGLKLEWGGAWGEKLKENSTAKIDYSGLANSKTAEELYKNLFDLIGCSIGAPCGTCSSQYFGINYTGSMNGFSADKFSNYVVEYHGDSGRLPGATLDITSWNAFTDAEGNNCTCFDLVNALISKHNGDKSLTEDQKSAEVKTLAENIASALCEKSYQLMTSDPSNKDHFDKALKADDYSIIVYDYRDKKDFMNNTDVQIRKSVLVSGYYQVEETYTIPAVVESKLMNKVDKLYIQCSSNENDKIPLDLPDISLERLGLIGYDVSRYNKYVEYKDSYLQLLQNWENSAYYVEKQEMEKYTWSEPVGGGLREYYNNNGEIKFKIDPPEKYIEHEEERLVTKREKVYPTPKPKQKDSDIITREVYEPSDVQLVSDALAYVTRARTNLGALQNRMEHAYRNNGNKYENTTASESAIRDTDMAKAMMEYSKNNILKQAGESLMAQANQSNQGVLQLLG